MAKWKEGILNEIPEFICPMAVSKFYSKISHFTDAKFREMGKLCPCMNWEGQSRCWRILIRETHLQLRVFPKLSSIEGLGRRQKGLRIPMISKGPF